MSSVNEDVAKCFWSSLSIKNVEIIAAKRDPNERRERVRFIHTSDACCKVRFQPCSSGHCHRHRQLLFVVKWIHLVVTLLIEEFCNISQIKSFSLSYTLVITLWGVNLYKLGCWESSCKIYLSMTLSELCLLCYSGFIYTYVFNHVFWRY